MMSLHCLGSFICVFVWGGGGGGEGAVCVCVCVCRIENAKPAVILPMLIENEVISVISVLCFLYNDLKLVVKQLLLHLAWCEEATRGFKAAKNFREDLQWL